MRPLLLTILATALLLAPSLRAQTPEHGQDARATESRATSTLTPDTPAGKILARVLQLFGGESEAITASDLDDAFKAQVPIAKLRQLAAQIHAAEGSLSLESINEGAAERSLVANVVGTKKKTPFRILLSINDKNEIQGLLIQPGVDARVPALKSWDDLKERLATASEKTSFTLREIVERTMNAAPELDGQPPIPTIVREAQSRVYHHSEDPLAIGSSFKLWVLAALGSAVEAGDLRWDEKLKIQDAVKSLPSGVMQDQPDGAEFTLRQFAEKMISISDNTATDHLILKLGRDRCERIMGRCAFAHSDRNAPFLTTRDLFALKLSGSDDLPKKYITAGTDTRREMVSPGGDVGRAKPHPILAAAWKAPRFIDSLEWFASGQDLATTMMLLDDLSRKPGLEPVRDILAINPGIPIDRKIWSYAGYKGGSEPGVLSLTWLLERRDGKKFILSITFNDTKKPIDEPLALSLAQRAVEYLGTFDVK